MPIPTPSEEEKEQEFISRCMGNDTMLKEYPDQKQRSGICYSQWEARNNREALHPHGEHICICSECGKEITVQENVKCNTQKCPDCGAPMVAKSAGERRESMVTKTKESLSVESLQDTYSEMIQEAGRRNAALDSARIKKIVQLCQELLSSEEEPDEKKIGDAIKKTKETIDWIKTLEASKTEDGQEYPAAAFAYTPEADKSSTWKLRIWEDPTKKVTRAQLGRAAAALSPGGFRGQKVQIPAEDMAAVKRKIRAEYRKLDVADEEIPRWVKESMTRELIQSYQPLTEAKFDKGRAMVVVIKAGFNATEERYYPVDMLRRDFKIFEGQKMYADHPTEAEDRARPERSIKDWVATLTEVKCDEDGTVTGTAEVIEPWMMQKLASLRDKNMLSEMGISINAVGHASKGKINGKDTLVIEELTGARSVDFVTEPGAGGVVTFYESDRTRDIDLIEIKSLKEKRPDLVKAIENEVREEITKEVKKMTEQEDKIKDLESQIETLTTERDQLKEAAKQAEKDQRIAEAQKAVKEAVDQAELPDAAKERLIEKFKDSESSEGIAEAIQAEKDYIAKLSESGKVKNLGPNKPEDDREKQKAALRESLKRANPNWTDAQLDTAINGR